MRQFWRRLGVLFHREKLERELEEEMRAHVEMAADEGGDANAARRAFGNRLRLKEESRDAWGWRAIGEFARDVRFAMRTLRRNPGFTAIALVSLALGIGVNTAVFTLADQILLRPLPVPHPEQLVSIYHRNAQQALISSSWPDYEYYRDHNEVFAGLAAYLRLPMVARTREEAEQVSGELVSGNFFSVLGVRAALGRVFREEDARIGAAQVAVLNYAYWQRRFGGDRGIAGQVIAIGGHGFTVIGVAPRAFRGVVMDWGGPPDLWVPITTYREAVPLLARFDVLGSWNMQSFPLVGRLREGVPAERAQAAISVLSSQVAPLREQAFQRRAEIRPVLLPLQQARFWPAYRGAVIHFLFVLIAAVALVLLIACFNIANLLLALSAKRRREFAVRQAMGVSRGRLVRQLLTESLLLSVLGGAAGLAVAAATTRLLIKFPGALGAPVVVTAGLDARAFGFALLVSLVAAILFGLAPARQAARVDLASVLKAEAAVRGRIPLRNALVAVQVALSLLLLIGGGLFARTLGNALAEDVVADPGRLLVARFDLASWGYDQGRARRFYQQVVKRVRSIPGMRGAALVWTLPLSGMRGETDMVVDENQNVKADRNGISPGYFQVAGLRLSQGREFTERDGDGAPPVAVINEEAARRFWPGQDPLGKRVRLKRDKRGAEVVGIVRDGQYGKLREPVRPCVYFPLDQSFLWAANLEVRTTGDPMQYVTAIRNEFKVLDRELPLSAVMTWESHREAGLSQERLAVALLGSFSVLALALAAAGIYGIVSFTVARRTREIGIRTALGARRGDVLRLMLWQGIAPALAGLVLGAAAALALTRYASELLYKVAATDTLTFTVSGVVLLAAAVAAAYFPARRATKIDPMKALRYE